MTQKSETAKGKVPVSGSLDDSRGNPALAVKLSNVHCGGCHMTAQFERVTLDPQVKCPNTSLLGLVAQLVPMRSLSP